jgi:hypothetical protein
MPTTNNAFPVTLWGFPSPQGNASKLGLDFHGMICHVLKKSIKLLGLVFSFAPGCNEPKKFR